MIKVKSNFAIFFREVVRTRQKSEDSGALRCDAEENSDISARSWSKNGRSMLLR